MAKTPKTKKPTGLSIKRDGSKFTFAWKIGDKDYGDGQQLRWRLSFWKKGTWRSESIGTSAKSKAITIDLNTLYPTKSSKATSITFEVRGNRKKYKSGKKNVNPTLSDWSSKSFTISELNKPTLTATLDETLQNVTVFAW